MSTTSILFSQPGFWIQLLLTFVLFTMGVIQAIKLYGLKSKTIKSTNINAILVIGVTVGLMGVLWQILGMVMALEAIIEAADISPQMVMEGFKISFYTTIYGFIVFILSAAIWYVNKLKWESNSQNEN